jgi:hypothetical protein
MRQPTQLKSSNGRGGRRRRNMEKMMMPEHNKFNVKYK